MTTPEQLAALAAYEARPGCDWDGLTRHPCRRKASFRWGDRHLCANHASGWLRQGKVMERLPGIQNPWPGNAWLWARTREVTPCRSAYGVHHWVPGKASAGYVAGEYVCTRCGDQWLV